MIPVEVQEQKKILKAILKAQEAERNRIGLELHDNVNQILVSARLYIDSIEKNPRIRKMLIANATEHIDLAIDDDLKLNIYRIVQEQIMNILKHACASAANITIRPVDNALAIKITDNGKGFDPSIKRKGIGIMNMINRVESYNGTALIDSNPGQGCSIDIRIPYSSPSAPPSR